MMMVSRIRCVNRIGWRHQEVSVQNALTLMWEQQPIPQKRYFARNRKTKRSWTKKSFGSPSIIDAEFYDNLLKERYAEVGATKERKPAFEKKSDRDRRGQLEETPDRNRRRKLQHIEKTRGKDRRRKQEYDEEKPQRGGINVADNEGWKRFKKDPRVSNERQKKTEEAERRRWEDLNSFADKTAREENVPPQRMFREDWLEVKKKPVVPEKKQRGQQGRRRERGGFVKQLRSQQIKGPQKPQHLQPSWTIGWEDNDFEEDFSYDEERPDPQPVDQFAANFPPNRSDIFVSCLPGLEPILAEEMKQLGFDCNIEAGGVTPTRPLTLEMIHLCHIHLGTASHILLRCGKPFTAKALHELKRKVSKQPWHQFINGRLSVGMRVTSKKSKLNHNTAIRSAILEGINESLMEAKVGKENSVYYKADETTDKQFKMVVRIEHDQVQISIDTWDTPMHRRGYRLETAKAPLREDLAFAMVYGAGWRPFHQPQDNPPTIKGMLDPFCGSGTIAIEAAAIAAGLPPGRLKGPPLHGTIWFKPKEWKQKLGKVIRKASRQESERKALQQIAASDRDEGAIEAAKANAERAGVKDWINFQPVAISAQEWLTPPKNNDQQPPLDCYPCLIATNPPWGLRLAADKKKGKVHPLLPLYQTLVGRQNLLNEKGCQVMAVTLLQDPNLFRRTGADMKVMWSSQHGGVPVAAILTGEPVEIPPTTVAKMDIAEEADKRKLQSVKAKPRRDEKSRSMAKGKGKGKPGRDEKSRDMTKRGAPKRGRDAKRIPYFP